MWDPSDWIAIVAIAATVALGLFGWLERRETRADPYRSAVHAWQIDYVSRLVVPFTKMHLAARDIIAGGGADVHSDFERQYRTYNVQRQIGLTVLPDKVLDAFNTYEGVMWPSLQQGARVEDADTSLKTLGGRYISVVWARSACTPAC